MTSGAVTADGAARRIRREDPAYPLEISRGLPRSRSTPASTWTSWQSSWSSCSATISTAGWPAGSPSSTPATSAPCAPPPAPSPVRQQGRRAGQGPGLLRAPRAPPALRSRQVPEHLHRIRRRRGRVQGDRRPALQAIRHEMVPGRSRRHPHPPLQEASSCWEEIWIQPGQTLAA